MPSIHWTSSDESYSLTITSPIAHLLNNPWAVDPQPQDYEIRPTYPVRSIPYYLAPLWDAAEFQRNVEAKLENRKKGNRKHVSGSGHNRPSSAEELASNVPREVRAKLKHARAAKGMLQDLEEQVRLFLTNWNERQRERTRDGLGDVSRPVTPTINDGFELVHCPKAYGSRGRADSNLLSDGGHSEDELVFVGRSLGPDADDHPIMLDSPSRAEREVEAGWEGLSRDKLVHEGLETDKGAAFARYLVHSIGAYYGLRTWSVTANGPPPMRCAFVGVDRPRWGSTRHENDENASIVLPRPLWGMI